MNSAYSDGSFYASNTRYNPFIAEMSSTLSPGVAVDFGCGIGTNLYNLMYIGWDVYAIDIEPLAVKKAREILPANHVHLSSIDEFNLSVVPDIDLVLCNYVFQHMAYCEIERFIQNVSCKTKQSGHFILSFFEHRGDVDFEKVASCFIENGWQMLKEKAWCREDLDHGRPHTHEGIESFWQKTKLLSS